VPAGGNAHKTNSVEAMLAALRPLVKARSEANALGLTDNHGAIHSIERVLNILRLRLVHPNIDHVRNIKHDPNVEGTAEAFAARERGERVDIEHVYPRREVAVAVCDLITRGASDRQLRNYIVRTSHVVLLTPTQRIAVDAVPGNRSRYTEERLKAAGIKVFRQRGKRSA
jgi:hypothetical protein